MRISQIHTCPTHWDQISLFIIRQIFNPNNANWLLARFRTVILNWCTTFIKYQQMFVEVHQLSLILLDLWLMVRFMLQWWIIKLNSSRKSCFKNMIILRYRSSKYTNFKRFLKKVKRTWIHKTKIFKNPIFLSSLLDSPFWRLGKLLRFRSWRSKTLWFCIFPFLESCWVESRWPFVPNSKT